MALKTKQKRFKEISGEMDLGGAPIYNADLVMLQQNSDADFINSAEYYRYRLPALIYATPAGKQFENGLILSGLTWVKNSPTQSTVNEGYFLSGGEVCYYPGGVFATGARPLLVHLKKGAANYTSRVFNDGFNKEITVNFDVVVETSEIDPVLGLEMPGATSIVPTDEVVVLEIGNVSSRRVAESYFTKEAAIGLNTIGARVSTNAFFNVTDLDASVTVGSGSTHLNFMGSRITKDGFVEVIGSISVASVGSSLITAFKLATGGTNITGAGVGIPFPVSLSVAGGFYETGVGIYFPVSRIVEIQAPTVGPTPGLFTTATKVFFNTRLISLEPITFTYEKDFLDVT